MDAESTLPQPPDPETLQDWLGQSTRETVFIGDRTYFIERPEKSDHLIDHPAVRSAFAADNYLPYWADLWPGARMLAKVIIREPWTPGTVALEVGCGLGLPGIAALSMGLRVTFSDYDPTALRFAADNARLNGFTDFDTLRLDWRSPPLEMRFPVVLASDLVYELRNVEPLVNLIKKVLAPGGLCLLTDQDRVPALAMREALLDSGLSFTTEIVRAGEPGSRRYKGTLYRITGDVGE
jgi:predicted nicotinamide N-methyase